MKKKLLYTVLLIFVFSFNTSILVAQGKTQMFLVLEDNVKTGMEKQYENVAKKHVELNKKYNFKFPFGVYSTIDNFYYWVTPIENLAGADEVFKGFEELESKLKDNNEINLHNEYRDFYNYMMPRTIVWSSELSYIPKEPRLEHSEALYVRWWFCYLYPSDESEFYQKSIKYVEYFKKSNVNSGFDTYYGVMGSEMPLIIYIERYKSEMDMLTTREAIFNSVDPKALELWEDMKKHIKRIEVKTGWFRADLLYIPEN